MKSIATAFVKAQKAFGPALKTASNPHFKSKYADLSACVEAVIDALNSNGVALVQATEPSERGVRVKTVFLHESGELLECGWLEVPAAKQDPQGYGSALTYARRYSLMTACGIAPEDDDGNRATEAVNVNRTLVMKVRSKIQEHIAAGRDLGVKQEWDDAKERGEEFYHAVWGGLTTPERDHIRALYSKAASTPVA